MESKNLARRDWGPAILAARPAAFFGERVHRNRNFSRATPVIVVTGVIRNLTLLQGWTSEEARTSIGGAPRRSMRVTEGVGQCRKV